MSYTHDIDETDEATALRQALIDIISELHHDKDCWIFPTAGAGRAYAAQSLNKALDAAIKIVIRQR